MAAFLFLLSHSTDDPDRAVAGLRSALAASEAGHDVHLWLVGEGVRLGVRAVAETMRPPAYGDAAATIERLVARGGVLHLARPDFEKREFQADALRKGAELAEDGDFSRLVVNGRVPVSF